MSRPGDQDQPTAAVPAAVPGTEPTADPAPGAQAWDAAVPAPTGTYPASAPTYPDADPYSRQSAAFPAGPQQYDQAAHQQYGQAAYQQYDQAAYQQHGQSAYPQYDQAPHPSAQYPQPGMGYAQPGAPFVAPGAPHPVGYGYPAREAPMCGLAVASLVCGIVWVYWITSILAIIFAAVALGRIKREGLRGRGLAIAGLVLGIVWTAFLVLGLIGFLAGGTAGILPFVNS